MGAHDNQVDILLLGVLNDLIKGRAGADRGNDFEPGELIFFDEALKRSLGRRQKLLDGGHDGRSDGDRLRLRYGQVLKNVQEMDFRLKPPGKGRRITQGILRMFAEVSGD